MLRSFEDLKSLLSRRDVPTLVDEERQAVEIPTFIRGEPHQAVLLWDPRASLLAVIQPIHVPVSAEVEPAVLDALARVNHALVLPGYGYDHERRTIYFRWVVPREPEGAMSEASLDRAVNTALQSCRDFLPSLRAVASGAVPSSAVLTHAAAQLQRERAGQA